VRGVRSRSSSALGDEKSAYLGGEPATDTRFVDSFAHALEHAGGYSREDAKVVARTLLPDILPYDPREPAGHPKNGGTLTDDVSDHFLALFTNRKVTVDGVGPHTDLLSGSRIWDRPTVHTRRSYEARDERDRRGLHTGSHCRRGVAAFAAATAMPSNERCGANATAAITTKLVQ
jgi:hypothetical protein